jgi:hypothetical protein
MLAELMKDFLCNFEQGYCTKHSRKRDSVDGSPKKTQVSTPKKHSEMSEEEKKAEKARKSVISALFGGFHSEAVIAK